MTGSPIGRPIDTDRALDWVRGSLAQGSDLARMVTQRLSRLTGALVLAPPSGVPGVEPVLDDVGRGVPSSEADHVADRLLREVGRKHTITLIVEDDVGRRGDPNIGQAAFVGNRIVRWEDIDIDGVGAAKLLRSGASGYPLNAYVCWGNASQLKLAPDRALSVVEQEEVANATCAVIVSVWDAEAYVAVLLPELERSLD